MQKGRQAIGAPAREGSETTARAGIGMLADGWFLPWSNGGD
ncbi:hypothetical protein GCM10027590_03740 [Nocardiopsis nanhaiensis]